MDGYWKVYFELNGHSIDDSKELCKRLSTQTEKAIFYLHPTKDKSGQELPHVHGFVFDWAKSDDTFRNEIKKTLGVKGSQLGVSNTYERGTKMSEEHIDKYVTYMTKGKYDPLFVKGIDNEYIDKCKRSWIAPTSISLGGNLTIITHGVVKRKEVTQASIANELSIWILMEQSKKVVISKNDIIDKCCELLKQYGKARHWRNVANICQDAMWDWDKEYCRGKIVSML